MTATDLVDELISFDYSAPGVASGYVYVQCEVCDAHTAVPEGAAWQWAEAHVQSRHAGGRHTHWVRPHEPLVLDLGDRGGRHRAIPQHPFVQHRGDDRWGCGHFYAANRDEDNIRCGFYRQYHPTMAGAI